MKLYDFIEALIKLEQQGHAELDVYYRHSSSGDCGGVNSVSITEECDPETGPFDTTSPYISISVGGN